MRNARRPPSWAPVVAAGIAVTYPAAVAAGAPALAAVTVVAAVAACAAALVRRPSGRMRLALAAITAWLTLGFAGAFVLRDHAFRGFGWVLLVLYAVPLPLVPWLYAKTFDGEGANNGRGKKEDGRGKTDTTETVGGSSPLSPLPSSRAEAAR